MSRLIPMSLASMANMAKEKIGHESSLRRDAMSSSAWACYARRAGWQSVFKGQRPGNMKAQATGLGPRARSRHKSPESAELSTRRRLPQPAIGV